MSTEGRWEDRVLIRELYDRLYAAWDAGDGQAMLQFFAPEGHSVKHDGSIATPADLARLAAAWMQEPAGVTRQHHLTSLIVDPHPSRAEDQRSVTTNFIVTEVQQPPTISIRWSCRTTDEVRRIGGQWRFTRCQTHLNHPGTA